jgi:alpha-ribazole phosphatase
MKLFVVRHGQTVQNVKKIIMGHGHGKLTSEGIKQAKLVGKRLKKEKIDFVYCSDLKRCKDTAREIHKFHKHVPIIYTPEIRETSYGRFEGRSYAKDGTTRSLLTGHMLHKKAPGGESLIDVRRRVSKFLKNAVKSHPNGTILVVTHGGTKRMIHHLLTKTPFSRSYKEIKFNNASICEYDWKNGYIKAVCVNDISHL